MNSPLSHMEKLRKFVEHELNMVQHIKELSRATLAGQILIDSQKTDSRAVLKALYRQIRIQTGYTATKHIIPWVSQQGFKANEMMYQSPYDKQNENPLDSIGFYTSILEVDEDHYAKAMAFLLLLTKKNHVFGEDHDTPDDAQFEKIIKLIRYNSFTIDHHHQAQLMPQFHLAEEQTGTAFLILQIAGYDVTQTDLDNIFIGVESLSRYSPTMNTLKLCGLEIQVQKSGKTKYTLSAELREKFRSKVEPFVNDYKSLWCDSIHWAYKKVG